MIRHHERPREKLQRLPVRSLSTRELIQLLVSTGHGEQSVERIARKIERLLLRHDTTLLLTELLAIEGVGLTKASRIIASLELFRRYTAVSKHSLDEVKRDAQQYAARHADCVCIYLDGSQRMISQVMTNYNQPQESTRLIIEGLHEAQPSGILLLFRDDERHLPSIPVLKIARSVFLICNALTVQFNQPLLIHKTTVNPI